MSERSQCESTGYPKKGVDSLSFHVKAKELNAEYIETQLSDIQAECVELNFSTCQGHVVELATMAAGIPASVN